MKYIHCDLLLVAKSGAVGVETESGIVVEPKMRQMLSQSAKASDIWTMIYLPNDSWSDLGEESQPI